MDRTPTIRPPQMTKTSPRHASLAGGLRSLKFVKWVNRGPETGYWWDITLPGGHETSIATTRNVIHPILKEAQQSDSESTRTKMQQCCHSQPGPTNHTPNPTRWSTSLWGKTALFSNSRRREEIGRRQNDGFVKILHESTPKNPVVDRGHPL